MSHKLSHSQIFLRGIHCRLAVTPQTAPALAVMFGADSVAQGSQSVPCGRPTWFLRLSQKVLCGIRIGFFHCRIVSRRIGSKRVRGLPECIFRAGRAQPLWLRSAGVGWVGLDRGTSLQQRLVPTATTRLTDSVIFPLCGCLAPTPASSTDTVSLIRTHGWT